ncbi:hypothetical protein [Nocardiopsis sp. RV163]|uniref:hypothetical protein n=1 Tax=Nocardiopsis sp. RV163 TaxID=1661388 RepID=UPI00064BE927|nr:hypothetical protein [Nocardiopsis sp. RV163]
MEHPDADRLAELVARLDPPTLAERSHIDGCARCEREVERFRTVISLVTPEKRDPLVSPPARVWDRVLAELDTDGTPVPGPSDVGPDSPASCGR